MTRYCSYRAGQQNGTLDRHGSARGDTRIEEKEQNKVDKYLNLAPGTQEALESEH